MGEGIDLTGRRFGNLIVLSLASTDEWDNRRWLCRCVCGKVSEHLQNKLTTGKAGSCGCLRNVKHRMSGSAEYRAWQGMRKRCYNPKNIGYKYYGGRGITVCDRWRESFENFFHDMGPRPDGRSLDRIDNDGPYAPENCRWATPAMQNNNSRHCKKVEFRGGYYSIAEIARLAGLSYHTVQGRYRSGKRGEQLALPSKRHPRLN